MHAIVAAGALAPVALRDQGIERIPLLCVAGETILARTCRCLKTGGDCDTVHVLAPESLPLPEMEGVRLAPYTGELINDFMNCIDRDTSGTAIFVASGDMPLISPEAVAAIREFALNCGADVVYPAVGKPDVEQRFPGTKRTYVKLGRQTVTGGNIFWLNRDWILGQIPLLMKLFNERKNPLGLAKIFGVGFFLRILFGIASLDYIEHHLSRVLHGKLRAAVLPYPELAVDLDKLADLETFAQYLDPVN